MIQYEMHEISIKGTEPEGSQVNVEVMGVFEHTKGNIRIETKGFYAGNGIYKVRFYPVKSGTYRYSIAGAVNETGTIDCKAAGKEKHGMVKASGTHFKYADGTWFYPFGTTVYALSHQEDDFVEETFETLKKAPFNKIRMCVFPKHYDYNNNEPPYFPFEKINGKWDMNRPCFRFWDRLEYHISRLNDMGVECDLILFHPYDKWGFASLTKEEALVYLDYVTRRLQAFSNIWWSLANEYDLLDYEQSDWETFADFIHNNDAYGHLLSNHQIVTPWDFSNKNTTHICLQTSELEYLSEDIKKYGKPLMVDECCYEGNIPMGWGNISGFEMVNRFWKVFTQGGYCTHGETFLNDTETLWWSKGGKLIGESPKRIGFLREIADSLPGPVSFNGKDLNEAEFASMKEHISEEQKALPFVKLMLKLPWEKAKFMLNANREMEGNCGTYAYIKYYGRHCTKVGSLVLPEDKKYDVEVIYVWEMTREKLLQGVSGKVEVNMPGKEGTALLAVKNCASAT